MNQQPKSNQPESNYFISDFNQILNSVKKVMDAIESEATQNPHFPIEVLATPTAIRVNGVVFSNS